MYTIVMRDDKSLVATVKTKIYQREKLVDKIQFLIPQTYDDEDLSKYTAILKYVDQGNVAHAERLVLDDELYKGHLRYTIPVNTNITRFSGEITMRITFSKVDSDVGVQHVMHTGEIKINICALEDYYKFVEDDSLEFVDRAVGALDTKLAEADAVAEKYNAEKADNIIATDNGIQLTADGKPIGDEVAFTDYIEFPNDDDDDGNGSGNKDQNCCCCDSEKDVNVVEFDDVQTGGESSTQKLDVVEF